MAVCTAVFLLLIAAAAPPAAAQNISGAAFVSASDAGTPTSNQSPSIASDGSTFVSAWWSEGPGGGWSIQVARSTDFGAHWTMVTNGNTAEYPLFPTGVSPAGLECPDWLPAVSAGAPG